MYGHPEERPGIELRVCGKGRFFVKIKGLGKLLLALWLIITGLSPFLTIPIPYRGVVMPLLALAAGIFLLLER